MFLSFAYHQQPDTALGGLLRTFEFETRVHRPLDHTPVTVHPPRGNRQDDPARRVQTTLCRHTSYTSAFPTIFPVTCACATAAVVVSTGLQMDPSLQHVTIKSCIASLQSGCSLFVCQYLERQVHNSLSETSVFPPLFFSSVRKVDTITLCFFISSEKIVVFIQSLLSHSRTVGRHHFCTVQGW